MQIYSITVYIPVGNFPMISDDLVNSYHLLLCALDLVYGNALQCSNRKELVNPNFKGKIISWSLLDYWHFYIVFTLGSCTHTTGFLASENISALKSCYLEYLSLGVEISVKIFMEKAIANIMKCKVLHDNFRSFCNIYTQQEKGI